MGRETLASRTTSFRESLRKSQINTEEMVTILGSFDHRLSALDTIMRPTQVRTHGIRVAHENIEKTLKKAGFILVQFDACRQVEAKIQRGPHGNLKSFLEALNQLKTSSEFFRANKSFRSTEGMLNIVNSMLDKAILKLEEEFGAILSSYSQPVERDHLFKCLPESPRSSSGASAAQGDFSDENLTPFQSKLKQMETGASLNKQLTLIPQRILPLLHDLAQQLDLAQRQMQCLKLYRESRSSYLEQSLQNLGVENLSLDAVQKMKWDVLEQKIRNWIRYIRIAVKLLFAEERKACNQIFEGIDHLRERCFAEVTSNSMQILVRFGDTVVKSTRMPEKVFAVLDMYEIMQKLQPEIETIFEGKSCLEIKSSVLSLTEKLKQTVQETLSSFQESIRKDPAKAIGQDGKVHPATSYVMNHVKFLLEYKSSLELIFHVETGGTSNNQLGTVIMRIIEALLSNLDFKSKQYKDPAMIHLFLMNNIHYVVTSVRKSEANALLGDDWVQRHRRIVKQNADLYRRVAFAEILQALSAQGLASTSSSNTQAKSGGSSGASREKVKERFSSFNLQFEELHQKQSHWTVADADLRESLTLMLAEVLVPAYRSFLKRFGPMIENSRNIERFIKYTPVELEEMLRDFFEGK